MHIVSRYCTIIVYHIPVQVVDRVAPMVLDVPSKAREAHPNVDPRNLETKFEKLIPTEIQRSWQQNFSATIIWKSPLLHSSTVLRRRLQTKLGQQQNHKSVSKVESTISESNELNKKIVLKWKWLAADQPSCRVCRLRCASGLMSPRPAVCSGSNCSSCTPATASQFWIVQL